jgi:hypothetical protein
MDQRRLRVGERLTVNENARRLTPGRGENRLFSLPRMDYPSCVDLATPMKTPVVSSR